MPAHTHEELHALDRVRYLLEEQSFRHLSLNDDEFASFIEALYTKVDQQMSRLEHRAT